MKKFLFLVILSLTLLSCEGPMGPQGPQGVPGEGMFWKYYTHSKIARLATCDIARRIKYVLHV